MTSLVVFSFLFNWKFSTWISCIQVRIRKNQLHFFIRKVRILHLIKKLSPIPNDYTLVWVTIVSGITTGYHQQCPKTVSKILLLLIIILIIFDKITANSRIFKYYLLSLFLFLYSLSCIWNEFTLRSIKWNEITNK